MPGVCEVGLCPTSLPSPLGQPHASFFYFLRSFLPLSVANVCSLASAAQLLAGVRQCTGTQKEKPKKRASGCWVQCRLKGWNEKRVICSPLDFLLPPSRIKKRWGGGNFKWRKLHQTALLKAARIPKHSNKSGTERQNFCRPMHTDAEVVQHHHDRFHLLKGFFFFF